MNKSLKQHIDSTRDEITQALLRSAKEYFDLGIDLYQKRQKYPYKGFQAILGNLSIAVELLLKCITAKKMFPLLYEGLSKNDLAILIAPENMPAGTLPNAFLGDLRTFTQKSIDFTQAVAFFYLIHPEKKQDLGPHLKLLSTIRNVSVHGAVPSFQLYHLDRVAYVACKLFLLVKEDKISRYSLFSSAEETQAKEIVSRYDDDRIKIVHEALEAAKKKSKSIDYLWAISLSNDDWEMRNETCPVCKNEAQVYGFTDHEQDEDGEFLFFRKEQFMCEACGLTLDDATQLELAGIDLSEDISAYLDEWHADNQDYKEYLRDAALDYF